MNSTGKKILNNHKIAFYIIKFNKTNKIEEEKIFLSIL